MGSENYAWNKWEKTRDAFNDMIKRNAIEIKAITEDDSTDEDIAVDERPTDDSDHALGDRLPPPPQVIELPKPLQATEPLSATPCVTDGDANILLLDNRARSNNKGVEAINVVPPEALATALLPDFDAGTNHSQQTAHRKARRASCHELPHWPQNDAIDRGLARRLAEQGVTVRYNANDTVTVTEVDNPRDSYQGRREIPLRDDCVGLSSVVEPSPSPLLPGVPSPKVTPGRHKIGDDVLASGILSPVPIPEVEVKHLRAGGPSRCNSKRSSPVYMQHERLPQGVCPEPNTYRSYGVAPQLPEIPFKGFYDLTDKLERMGMTTQWATAIQYRDGEFEAAKRLLAPVIRHLTGEDYFFEFKVDAEWPRFWARTGMVYPPTKSKNCNVVLDAFGYRYSCDHKWSSGCLETAFIKREYAFSSTRSIYSLALSRGRHRIACNHSNCGNTTHSCPNEKIAKMHPAVDMYIRKEIRNNPKITYRKLEAGLAIHIRSATGLHCSFPRDGSRDTSAGTGKGGKSICTHQDTYQVVANNPHYRGRRTCLHLFGRI